VKIAGSYQVPIGDQERVYRALQDPEVLARCIPGCEGLELAGVDEYSMKMKMVLAAVSGQFAGKVKIADRAPSMSFRLIVEGAGKIGFVKGSGVLALQPSSDGAMDVHYDGEVRIGGTIAAVGQRLMDTTSKLMIKRFFDKFSEEVRSHG
jgi:uncharacterized protein